MGNCDFQEKLNAIVEQAKLKFDVPSISVSVMSGGNDYFYSTGVSDIEQNVEATPQSVYAIASSSKAFIATSLCILAEKGKLSLDKPVKEYLPDFEMHDPYMSEHLMIRDALSHRTGLPRHDVTWYTNPDTTIYDTVKSLKYLPAAYEPRYRMHYQNHMFALASVLTEKVSGMPWQEFVKTRIFEPLGMTNTYATGDLLADDCPVKARPYKKDGDKYERLPYVTLSNVGCCGSIFSTTEDLLKWAKFNLYGNEKILSNKYLKELHMPHTVIKPGDFSPTDLSPEVELTSYGLGWFIESYRGHKMVHHGGTIDGFKSLVGIVPGKDIAFSVLSNLNRNQSPMAIAYAIVDELLGLSAIDWNEKIAIEFEKQKQAEKDKLNQAEVLTNERKTQCHSPQDYVGEYVHPAYGKIRFIVDGDNLSFQLSDQVIPVHYLGGEEFIPVAEALKDLPELCKPLYFEKDGEGKVISLNIYFEEKLAEPIRFDRA